MSAALDTSFLDACRGRIAAFTPVVQDGCVRSLVGTVIEGEGLPVRVGSVCDVDPGDGRPTVRAEVVAFRDDRFLLLPLAGVQGVGPGARIRLAHSRSTVVAGNACLGRVLDGLGRPIDGGPPIRDAVEAPLLRRPEPSLTRDRVCEPLDLGVRAINGFLTVGRGARMGIFAGSGVGKSTLLGQIARHTAADVIVVGLVGERGREVREFIERDLGSALERSVLFVATSDEPPLLRVRTAHAATAVAESFRDEGRQVLLLMDSVTRYCTALREIGLAAGEPPTTRGFPPSVWSSLPRLLERAGTSASGGSITGIYTVLVEGDDPNEPVSDATRAILDGHILLSRELAERGQFPAIDVLASVSRVMPDVVSEEHAASARRARELLATYRRAEDLISIGAYQEGSDASIDEARRFQPALRSYLEQPVAERVTVRESASSLAEILGQEAA